MKRVMQRAGIARPGEPHSPGGDALDLVKAGRGPLLTALAAAGVLALPPQTLEIYRTLALDPSANALTILSSGLALFLSVLAIGLLVHAVTTETGFINGARRAAVTSALIVPLGLALGLHKAGDATRPILTDQPQGAIDPAVVSAIAKTNALPELLTYSTWGVLLIAAVAALLLWLLLLRARPRGDAASRFVSFRGISFPLYVIGLVNWLAIVRDPVGFARSLGSITLFLVFTVLLATVSAELTRIHARYRIPALSLVVLFAAVLSFFNINDNHLAAKVARKPDAREVVPTALAFQEWLNQRADRDRFREAGQPYPVFIISAEGGGLYAAKLTATFLARAQDRCPSFAQHVFAISGVSGGAVGGGVFAGLAKSMAKNAPWQDCKPGDLGIGPMEQKTRAVLDRDFLSPIVAAALFPDFTHTFLPVLPGARHRDRARVFEMALEEAMAEAVAPAANPLTEPYLSSWDLRGPAPALLANTTQVENGMRVVVAPFMSIDAPPVSGSLHQRSRRTVYIGTKLLDEGWEGLKPDEDIRLSTAIGLSTRFPWIMPAGRFKTSKTEFRLVDGAFIDNSGDETAFDIVEELGGIKAVGGKLTDGSTVPDFKIHLISLTDHVEPEPGAVQGFGGLLSPLRAMLTTRPTRSELARHRIRAYLNRDPGIFVGTTFQFASPTPIVELNHTEFSVPMGWQISKASHALIAAQSGEAHRCGFAEVFSVPSRRAGLSYHEEKALDRVTDLVRSNNCVACSIPYRLMGTLPKREQACAGP